MSKNLLIVESPSKARTIKKYLGKDFEVLASVGHIRDLPKKELGVDLENDFTPKYINIRGKGKIIKQLQSAAKGIDTVYLAPDPDREGEAIAWHISKLLKVPEHKIKRVLFNEITKSGVLNGIKNPRKIDTSLVDAQQARRVLDRIVGYLVSPFLWKTLYRGLSAGRVQSVAVRLICEREAEIEAFKPQEFWNLFADLKTPEKEEFQVKCVKHGGKKITINNESEAKQHVGALEKAEYSVESIVEKEAKKSPFPPFITSTLQQEATRRYKYSPKKTMMLAQQLYEGIDIHGEPVGLITYMRTDSVRMSNEAVQDARDFINNNYGEKYLPNKPRFFKSKKKNTQDAHEAIRPTRFDLDPKKLEKYLNAEQIKIYNMIWKRFIACQMAPAIYAQKVINVVADKYHFKASGSDLLFDGYLKAFRSDKVEKEKEQKVPKVLSKNDILSLIKLTPEQKFTEPPIRFNDGTLVKELDTLGIGRPSTYATIISTILDRNYVERDSGTLYPTELGRTVNKILVSGMPEIFSVEFTSKLENELDAVEESRIQWKKVMAEFYQPFNKSLSEMETHRKEIKESLQEVTEEKCEQCGEPLVVKWSRNGKFIACSGFPNCRYTRPLNPVDESDLEKKKCHECGSDMVLKEGRFGKFWACTKYPECKTTLPYVLDISCPNEGCDGKVTQKKTRRGKVFFGCSNYPDCKFASWNEPVNQTCENCGNKFLEKKKTQRRGAFLKCPKCKEEFEIEEKSESK